jgi:hypothetical protein
MLNEYGFIDMEARMNDAIRDLAIDADAHVAPGPPTFADFTHLTDEGSQPRELASNLRP